MPAPNAQRPPITLLLQGGGIRFPAFIGALRAIEEKGLPIGKIVAASTGGIVGILYAAGMTTVQLEEEVLRLDIARFRDPGLRAIIGGKGFCAGAALEGWLEQLLGGRRFADKLRVPLQVVATDILNYFPLVFSAESHGDVPISLAARASAGIPWVFAQCPFTHRGRKHLLIDGSMMVGVVERSLERSERVLVLKTVSKRSLNHPGAGSLSVQRYFQEMITFTIHALEKEFIKGASWKDNIILFCGDVPPARFSLARDEKRFLIDQGYEQTLKYLSYKCGI